MADPHDYQIPEEDKPLLASDDEFQCPFCKGEIGMRCDMTPPDHQGPPLCGCEGTEFYGLCKCDTLVCMRCGRELTETVNATEGGIILP